jgi:hypothetical protein
MFNGVKSSLFEWNSTKDALEESHFARRTDIDTRNGLDVMLNGWEVAWRA